MKGFYLIFILLIALLGFNFSTEATVFTGGDGGNSNNNANVNYNRDENHNNIENKNRNELYQKQKMKQHQFQGQGQSTNVEVDNGGNVSNNEVSNEVTSVNTIAPSAVLQYVDVPELLGGGQFPELNLIFGDQTQETWNSVGEDWMNEGWYHEIKMYKKYDIACEIVGRKLKKHKGNVHLSKKLPKDSGDLELVAGCWARADKDETYGHIRSNTIKMAKKIGSTHVVIKIMDSTAIAESTNAGLGVTSLLSRLFSVSSGGSVNPSIQYGSGNTKPVREPYAFMLIYRDFLVYQK